MPRNTTAFPPGGNPVDLSRALRDKADADAQAAAIAHREKLVRISDEVHDILIREDLTPNEWANISQIISGDINSVAGKTKLTKLYENRTRKEANGSGEGEDAPGQREGDRPREGDGAPLEGAGRPDGSPKPAGEGDSGRGPDDSGAKA